MNLKQINNKRTLVNLYKDIVLVTRLRIFCTKLFTNNNIKIVIQKYASLFNRIKVGRYVQEGKLGYNCWVIYG